MVQKRSHVGRQRGKGAKQPGQVQPEDRVTAPRTRRHLARVGVADLETWSLAPQPACATRRPHAGKGRVETGSE